MCGVVVQGEQSQGAEEAPKTWGQRLGGFIFRSSSKPPKDSSAGRSPGLHCHHQPHLFTQAPLPSSLYSLLRCGPGQAVEYLFMSGLCVGICRMYGVISSTKLKVCVLQRSTCCMSSLSCVSYTLCCKCNHAQLPASRELLPHSLTRHVCWCEKNPMAYLA